MNTITCTYHCSIHTLYPIKSDLIPKEYRFTMTSELFCSFIEWLKLLNIQHMFGLDNEHLFKIGKVSALDIYYSVVVGHTLFMFHNIYSMKYECSTPSYYVVDKQNSFKELFEIFKVIVETSGLYYSCLDMFMDIDSIPDNPYPINRFMNLFNKEFGVELKNVLNVHDHIPQ